ncbi:MAG: hypothetical protein MZV65_46090 [Chromatiales bacterium]|nr:hypothetical protein [Chromatiales bacterium]
MLSDWIETHREQLKAGQDLEEAAEEWQAIGKPGSALASGARLKRYRQAIKPSALADRFLRASRRRLWSSPGYSGRRRRAGAGSRWSGTSGLCATDWTVAARQLAGARQVGSSTD